MSYHVLLIFVVCSFRCDSCYWTWVPGLQGSVFGRSQAICCGVSQVQEFFWGDFRTKRNLWILNFLKLWKYDEIWEPKSCALGYFRERDMPKRGFRTNFRTTRDDDCRSRFRAGCIDSSMNPMWSKSKIGVFPVLTVSSCGSSCNCWLELKCVLKCLTDVEHIQPAWSLVAKSNRPFSESHRSL